MQNMYYGSVQDEDEAWILSFAEKKKIYDTMMVKVGGKNEPDDDLAGPCPHASHAVKFS